MCLILRGKARVDQFYLMFLGKMLQYIEASNAFSFIRRIRAAMRDIQYFHSLPCCRGAGRLPPLRCAMYTNARHSFALSVTGPAVFSLLGLPALPEASVLTSRCQTPLLALLLSSGPPQGAAAENDSIATIKKGASGAFRSL
jgi:hypothetical protein